MSSTTKASRTRVTANRCDPVNDTGLAEMVIAAQRGDPAAFTELVTVFGHTVYRTALRVTRDPEDAADVAQQTWLTAMQKLPRLSRPESFPGWLGTTTRRHALRLVRDRDRVRATDPDVLDRCDVSRESVEVVVEGAETAERVRHGMARLPREHAYVLVELVCNGRPYKELAAELGRPVGSLGPSRARYLQQLAQEISALGVTAA